jgi:hypothetical protein
MLKLIVQTIELFVGEIFQRHEPRSRFGHGAQQLI